MTPRRGSSHKLKQLGMRITMDDFGTGHSSLNRLSQLPFDTLKIPRTFIERITENEADLALTQGIVDLAHRLGLDVVAEGIETPAELSHARPLGCEVGQGFHLGMPACGTRINPGKDCLRLDALGGTTSPVAHEAFSLNLVPGDHPHAGSSVAAASARAR